MPAPRKSLNNKRWWRIRDRQLALNPLCVECEKEDTATPTGPGQRHADHIDPDLRHPEGLHDGPWEGWQTDQGYTNLQTLCVHHHSLKTAKEQGKRVCESVDASGYPESWQ